MIILPKAKSKWIRKDAPKDDEWVYTVVRITKMNSPYSHREVIYTNKNDQVLTKLLVHWHKNFVKKVEIADHVAIRWIAQQDSDIKRLVDNLSQANNKLKLYETRYRDLNDTIIKLSGEVRDLNVQLDSSFNSHKIYMRRNEALCERIDKLRNEVKQLKVNNNANKSYIVHNDDLCTSIDKLRDEAKQLKGLQELSAELSEELKPQEPANIVTPPSKFSKLMKSMFGQG